LNAPEVTAVRPVDVPVVLVDDVLTTGSSIAAAASALRAAGAPSVVAAVVALTPESRSSRNAPEPKEVIHPAELKN
jgi:orotate phosphoribosyltransferase